MYPYRLNHCKLCEIRVWYLNRHWKCFCFLSWSNNKSSINFFVYKIIKVDKEIIFFYKMIDWRTFVHQFTKSEGNFFQSQFKVGKKNRCNVFTVSNLLYYQYWVTFLFRVHSTHMFWLSCQCGIFNLIRISMKLVIVVFYVLFVFFTKFFESRWFGFSHLLIVVLSVLLVFFTKFLESWWWYLSWE